MKQKIILGAAFVALAATSPAVLEAQQLPPAVIAVVNRNQIARDCTPCAAALGTLNQQRTALQALETQLVTPLQNEGNAIRTALQALPQGTQPDATLQQRMQAFENNRQTASNRLQAQGEQISQNEQYIVRQILQRMQPLIQNVANQRGATLTLDATDTLTLSPALDITAGVLALMNQNTAPFATTAPAPAPAPAPAGARPATPTPPAPAQPNRPRPQGR
jgi:Skp family chaperone for outer membrane proteins